MAIIDVEDIYDYDAKREAELTYGTTDDAHPGVAYLYSQAPHYVGGEVTVLENVFAHEFSEYRMTPLQLREKIASQRLEDHRCVPDSQPNPPSTRVPHEVRTRDHRRPRHPSPRRRHQG